MGILINQGNQYSHNENSIKNVKINSQSLFIANHNRLNSITSNLYKEKQLIKPIYYENNKIMELLMSPVVYD